MTQLSAEFYSLFDAEPFSKMNVHKLTIKRLSLLTNHFIIWVTTQRKGPYAGKIKIEFCIVCSRGHSVGYFGTKTMYLTQILTELLQILSFKTCIVKN